MIGSISLEMLLQTIAAGVLIGCTYGLMCVALGLIFGVMRLINFAQGDFLMLGGMVTAALLGANLQYGPAVAIAVRGHRLLTAMPYLRSSPACPSVHMLMPYLAMV